MNRAAGVNRAADPCEVCGGPKPRDAYRFGNHYCSGPCADTGAILAKRRQRADKARRNAEDRAATAARLAEPYLPGWRWTRGDVAQLIRLRKLLTNEQIAAKLGRTTAAVKAMVRKLRGLGVEIPTQTGRHGPPPTYPKARRMAAYYWRRGYMPAEIGRRLGVNTATVTHWAERGNWPPPEREHMRMAEVAAILGVSWGAVHGWILRGWLGCDRDRVTTARSGGSGVTEAQLRRFLGEIDNVLLWRLEDVAPEWREVARRLRPAYVGTADAAALIGVSRGAVVKACVDGRLRGARRARGKRGHGDPWAIPVGSLDRGVFRVSPTPRPRARRGVPLAHFAGSPA